jgi:hypothetical protein
MSKTDPFETLRSLTPEEVEKYQAARPMAKSSPSRKSEGGMHYWLPEALIEALVKVDYLPAWRLALAIYKTWYRDRDHVNPVKLTSACLEEFRISRDQKLRSLKILKKTGLFLVNHSRGRNPLVTMTWPLKY